MCERYPDEIILSIDYQNTYELSWLHFIIEEQSQLWLLINYDILEVDDGPDFILSPNALRSLLNRAREETGLKHLLTMD